jgi:hypothetical protein
MTFLPGTHFNQLAHTENPNDAANMLAFGQTLQPDGFLDDPVVAPLRPGEFSLHHFRLAHKSGPNSTTDRRIGFAIRYIATDVQRIGNTKEAATLVRGHDRFGYFDHEPTPQNEMEDAMVVVHADSMRRENENYYQVHPQARM